jgi:hypothetical protein
MRALGISAVLALGRVLEHSNSVAGGLTAR